jgi:ATP-dependent helicase HrpB
VLPELVSALRAHSCAVLRAPTGAGKTTRVPPALLDAGLAGDGAVVMLEPRRVAARAAARRMAEERGSELGAEIGYQVRFERRAGRSTRILVLTEGLLVRRLVDDPLLEGVGALVFDEFHERNVDTDLALALARRVQLEARPDLRLVVMSGTIDAGEIARWLGDAPVIASEGRLHPVTIEHLERDDDRPLPVQVAGAVGRALERTSGTSCLLPGWGDPRFARGARAGGRAARTLLAELYGDLRSRSRIARCVRAEAPRRARDERGRDAVTVQGVTAVVDSGLARVSRFGPAGSMPRSRADLARLGRRARGRAGRTARDRAAALTEREQPR